MRIAVFALALAGAAIVPSIASAQGVVIEQRSEPDVIVREPAERRVIVREPQERVIVDRPSAVVRRYVVEERRPSISYEQRVVVGDTLPGSVDVYDVPDSDYGYTVLNDRRYIVDDDRRIVDVVE